MKSITRSRKRGLNIFTAGRWEESGNVSGSNVVSICKTGVIVSKSKFARFRPANDTTTDVRISWVAYCNATSGRWQQANDLVAEQDAVPLRQQFLCSLVPVLVAAFQPSLLISPQSAWLRSPCLNTCGGDVALCGFHPGRSTGRAPGPASWRYRWRSATFLRHTPANE